MNPLHNSCVALEFRFGGSPENPEVNTFVASFRHNPCLVLLRTPTFHGNEAEVETQRAMCGLQDMRKVGGRTLRKTLLHKGDYRLKRRRGGWSLRRRLRGRQFAEAVRIKVWH